MTVLRCTAKLLKRMGQQGKLADAAAPANPLGEWYADIDFIDREPFVLLLNAATGAGIVTPGRVEHLRQLHAFVHQQLGVMFRHYGIDARAPGPAAELLAWEQFPTLANTRDRSILGSMSQFKDAAWHHFAHTDRHLPEAASRQWEGLYRHPSFAKPGRRYSYEDWQKPLDLVWARLAAFATADRPHGSLH